MPAKTVKVLTFGKQHRFGPRYFEGTSTGAGDKWSVWVSWKENGQPERAKLSRDEVWLDTTENRKILDKICEARRQRFESIGQENRLIERLTRLLPDQTTK